MKLRDFFDENSVDLDLGVSTRHDALRAMVSLLRVDAATSDTVVQLLDRREQLGSTGVGRGIAIPHCRAAVVPQLRLAFGRVPAGLSYDAIDGLPVKYLFLIVAPPVEVSNLYLPVLGRLAQVAKSDDFPDRLASLTSTADFFSLLDARDS